MKQVHRRVFFSMLVAICILACTDKDRAMAKKTNDGTETFAYRPTAPLGKDAENGIGGATKTQRSRQPLPPQASPEQRIDIREVGNTKKFEYNPDPRLLKQMSKKSKRE